MLRNLSYLVLSIIFCEHVFAHSGRLDRFGCHHDRINGGYHCHRDVNLTSADALEYWGHVTAIARYTTHLDKHYKSQKMELVEFGDKLADATKKSLIAGDLNRFGEETTWLSHIADAVLSLAPGVGWAKDTYEFVTGKDLLSQKRLTEEQLTYAMIGALTGGVGSKAKVFSKVVSSGPRILKSVYSKSYTYLERTIAAIEKQNIKFMRSDAYRFKNNPLRGKKYIEKVKRQMKQDKHHGFPDVVDNFAALGKKSKLKGGDGVERDLIRLDGKYLGKKGEFEWIIEPDGMINHRKSNPRW